LETGAGPGLKVWYASALAKLGDRNARKRLAGLAHNKRLDIAFPAALKLADVSRPGDKPALDALRALAAHEAALKDLVPNPGAVLLGKLAALRDEQARKLLYGLLDDNEEGVRLTAAEQLADLGNDAGHQVLQGILANRASPNRLLAAAALILLGDYSGRDVITDALNSMEPAARSRAARALGDIGDRHTIDALVGLGGDKEWSVRIAAATAIVVILGVDPAVLAQASVDWAQSAFDSDDLALHKAAAGVLSDLPAKDAARLLVKAIADKDAGVRLAASRSAGRIKTAESAATVVAAVKAEADPKVKEQQVKALGEIGEVAGTESRAALSEIAEQPGRIGVIAAGSLIAVGDTAGQAKLETAIAARAPDLRLAAAEAAAAVAEQVNATAPGRLVVVPTLKIGILDREFSVRFAAAEGLSRYDAEKDAAVPVLEEARKRSDVNV
ncbi:MAG: HEAT repeat domain-containing protein, partial [Solirubrobacteraceae bacterium]